MDRYKTRAYKAEARVQEMTSKMKTTPTTPDHSTDPPTTATSDTTDDQQMMQTKVRPGCHGNDSSVVY